MLELDRDEFEVDRPNTIGCFGGYFFLNMSLTRIYGVRFPGLTPEIVDLLKYGRGLDNGRLKRAGFDYTHTSAGAVRAFIESLRLMRTVGPTRATYQYEQAVEEFFRRSPSVVRNP